MNSSAKQNYSESDSNILVKEESSQKRCNEVHRNQLDHSPPNVVDKPRKISASSHYLTGGKEVKIETKASNKVKIETKDNESDDIWSKMKTSISMNSPADSNSIEIELILPFTDPLKVWSSPVNEVDSLWRPPSGQIVRMNFPNLTVPDQMFFPYEKALYDLHLSLRDEGFNVTDRTTLAFFALGKELNIPAAAQCFLHIYQLLNSAEFQFPNRSLMEQTMKDTFVEGFARHHDGTFGALLNLKNWNVAEHVIPYLFREVLCYIFNMVDYTLLRGGLTNVMNGRNITWRSFAPFEQAKAMKLWRKCCPMTVRRNFLVDLGTYGKIAHSVLSSLASINNLSVLSIDDARCKYPDVVLPKSLTGLTSEHIENLTCDEQMSFHFFLD